MLPSAVLPSQALSPASSPAFAGLSVMSNTVVDPAVEYWVGIAKTFVSYTADNSNDILGFRGDLSIDQNGHHITAVDMVGLYGNAFAIGSSGTVEYANGVQGVAGNSGAGTLTNAVSLRTHAPYNTGGGRLINWYGVYDNGGGHGIAENCYGGIFSNPVSISDLDTPQLPGAGLALDVIHGPARLYRSGGSAQPASSGTTISVGTRLIMDDNSGAAFYAGMNGGSGAWFQVAATGSLGVAYPLQLQPISGVVSVGPGGLSISANVSPLPAMGPTGTLFQIGGADGLSPRSLVDAFGNAPQFTGRRASGTAAAPTAVQTNQQLVLLSAFGYGATGYSSGQRGAVIINAAENWTDTAQGSYQTFFTTALGTVSSIERMRLNQGLAIGGTTDPGLGCLSTSGTINVGTMATSDPHVVGQLWNSSGTVHVSAG